MFGYVDGPGHADAAYWVESRIDVPIRGYRLKTLCQGIYAISNVTEVICIQLPSLSRGVPLRMWTLGLGFPVEEIEIDPSNNLLAVLPMRVSYVHMGSLCRLNLSQICRTLRSWLDPSHITLHLRMLSDNTPHPNATNPILFSTLSTFGYRHLGVVRIWNWMTEVGWPFRSYKFLSATSFLVPCGGSLEVYEIPVESPGAPPMHTASFRMSTSETACFVRVGSRFPMTCTIWIKATASRVPPPSSLPLSA
ncbi:hypothetical protein BS47DRAFT_1348119 [Hydnum rufescens UP504]|uniref:F-box domain-containing protein n=1 Tax=Hydnum rufescens UP504 TaxID=1448309 RepID=A0A9P6AR18_9AGAM|nr:hypothetical protein BS47DRAFT_1348119 [Hydnum rufescens UP504]